MTFDPLFLRVGSKVICGIIALKERELGNEAATQQRICTIICNAPFFRKFGTLHNTVKCKSLVPRLSPLTFKRIALF